MVDWGALSIILKMSTLSPARLRPHLPVYMWLAYSGTFFLILIAMFLASYAVFTSL